jgi:octaprenyl-diphosphate synthase
MCAGELLHLGSLLHDDVVDDGAVRRGRPAAHVLYGNAVSVLTGDFCLARAVLLASEESGHACVTALSRAVVEMAEGEVLQLQRAGDLSTDRATYFDVVERKSAALIAWCVSAAAHASEDAPRAAALEHFGRAVGIAFQITDDVIDYFDGTGKAAGADLRDRKVTLPLLFAMEADPGLRDELEAGADDARIPVWIERIRASGAIERALGEARDRVDVASVALDVLPDGPGRDALLVLGRHLVERVR